MKLGHTGQGAEETQRGQCSQGQAAGGLENLLSLRAGNGVLAEGNGVSKAPEGGEREFQPPHEESPLYKEVSAQSQQGSDKSFLGSSNGKNMPTMRETWVPSLSQEDPLEKGMATHSNILA